MARERVRPVMVLTVKRKGFHVGGGVLRMSGESVPSSAKYRESAERRVARRACRLAANGVEEAR